MQTALQSNLFKEKKKRKKKRGNQIADEINLTE